MKHAKTQKFPVRTSTTNPHKLKKNLFIWNKGSQPEKANVGGIQQA